MQVQTQLVLNLPTLTGGHNKIFTLLVGNFTHQHFSRAVMTGCGLGLRRKHPNRPIDNDCNDRALGQRLKDQQRWSVMSVSFAVHLIFVDIF